MADQKDCEIDMQFCHQFSPFSTVIPSRIATAELYCVSFKWALILNSIPLSFIAGDFKNNTQLELSTLLKKGKKYEFYEYIFIAFQVHISILISNALGKHNSRYRRHKEF